MKRNPRKVKWTKAYRKLAGKELAEVRNKFTVFHLPFAVSHLHVMSVEHWSLSACHRTQPLKWSDSEISL